MQKIAVIGGGASGLVAAINAKNDNNEVIVLEKNSVCGKKILVTGAGKCNYFNENQNTFWGTGRLTDAWFVVIVLVLMYLYLRFCLRKKYKHVL